MKRPIPMQPFLSSLFFCLENTTEYKTIAAVTSLCQFIPCLLPYFIGCKRQAWRNEQNNADPSFTWYCDITCWSCHAITSRCGEGILVCPRPTWKKPVVLQGTAFLWIIQSILWHCIMITLWRTDHIHTDRNWIQVMWLQNQDIESGHYSGNNAHHVLNGKWGLEALPWRLQFATCWSLFALCAAIFGENLPQLKSMAKLQLSHPLSLDNKIEISSTNKVWAATNESIYF